jgi:glycosyltransferase involved in cell wall biosynthesis
VVSTTLGAEGLPAEDGRDLILADDPDRFAAAVSGLLASPARRAALGARGRALFEARLNWATVWPLLESALALP